MTCSNKADGFYTSPRSCSEYITCAAGIAYVIKCGQGLVYNANLHVCDWPANYHCTVRWAGCRQLSGGGESENEGRERDWKERKMLTDTSERKSKQDREKGEKEERKKIENTDILLFLIS